MTVKELLDDESRGTHEPSFLRHSESHWPQNKIFAAPKDDDPEVKSDVWCAFTFSEDEKLLKPENVSSYYRLLRVTAYLLRFVNNCRAGNKVACVTDATERKSTILAPASGHLHAFL